MRILVVLSSLQLILMLFLIVAISRDDATAERGAQAVDSSAVQVGRYDVPPATAVPALDETRLRQIIREELGYLTRQVTVAGQQEGNANAMATEDLQVRAQQRDYVAQQIEYYRSMGAISNEEMDELQFEVARLGSADRKQMMSRLVRAMNAGEIRGKLQ